MTFLVGQRDARRFNHAGDGHVEIELRLDFIRLVDGTADRGGSDGIGGRSERDVALPGEQAGGGIKADPARAGQINLGPGVKVGEVSFRAGSAPIDRLHIGSQLDEITGNEAGGQAELTANLDEEPGRVAAGTALESKRFFHRLHARLHPDDIGNFVMDEAVEIDEEVDGLAFAAGNFMQKRAEARPEGFELEVGFQFVRQDGVVAEREFVGALLDKKIEGVDRRHVGGEFNLDLEFIGLFRKDESGLEIALRILLPVDEVVLRGDFEDVIEDRRPAVDGGTEADNLRSERNGFLVAVVGDVSKCGVNGHDENFWKRGQQELSRSWRKMSRGKSWERDGALRLKSRARLNVFARPFFVSLT